MQSPLPPLTPAPLPPPAPPPAMLAYAVPLHRARPGVITALGVLSIVFGSLGALYSVQSGAGAIAFMMLSRFAASMPASATTVTTTSSGSGTFTTSTTVTSSSAVVVGGFSTTPTTAPLTGATSAGTSPTNPTSTGPAGPGPAGGVAPFRGISVPACVTVAAENLLSLGLAVWLIVAGIQTLRQSPKAAKLHTLWAWLKIPLSAIGAAAYAWMMTGLLASSGATTTPGRGLLFGIYATMMLVLGCAYPVAVLITLRTRSVRAYYHSIVVPNG